jgi:hypothetical protein
VWILVRVLVEGPHDFDTARSLQRAITITTPADHPSTTTERLGRPNSVHEVGAAYFDELAAAVAVDPPADWHPLPSDAALGVATGALRPHRADLEAAVVEGDARIVAKGLGADERRNGWGTRRRGSDFGDDVLTRAACAKYVLAGHHPVENRSYIGAVDAAGARLDGRRALALHFPPGGEPPCTGFWSLTVYGPDMFLVANDLDRYSIGDRTPGLRRDDDGGLSITIGGPRPDDTTNWLPAPDGPYGLGLRVYEGAPQVVDASWFPPPLTPHLEI